MKPIYLEFCGINSFSERAQIDFRALLEYGIFGIFGDTGSGKSTILDCIGFALYGSVSRARAGSGGDVINYRQDKANVYFEFEIMYEGSRRSFRVEREIKRKNAAQTLKVYERRDEKLVVLADTVREGNALLGKIIGLEQRDFERCIALPQGEFSQFVKATRSERLKLVSRLFDLEEYGERLIKKTNARYYAAESERNILLAKLEQFSNVTEEQLARCKDEIENLERAEKEYKESLSTLRAEEKSLSDLLERRKEWERLSERLGALQARRAEMLDLERELGRIERVESVVHADEAVKAAERERNGAEQTFTRLQGERANAEQRVKEFDAFDENAEDEEIAHLTELCVRLEHAEKNAKRREELTRVLKRAREEYAAEIEKFKTFSYESERETLEAELNALGNENFLGFVEKHAKAALLRSEYAAFAQELQTLKAKYPMTETDVAPLIERYEARSAGEKTEFSEVRRAFETREEKRAAVQSKLVQLEQKNGLYRAHCERLQRLQTEGVRAKEELSTLGDGEETAQSSAQTEQLLNRKKREKRERIALREQAFLALSKCGAEYAAAEERKNAANASVSQAQTRLRDALAFAGLERVEEAVALVQKYGNGADAVKRVNEFREEYASVSARVAQLGTEKFDGTEEQRLQRTRADLAERERDYERTTRELALKRDELRRGGEALEKKRALEREESLVKKRAEIADRLKKLLEGNKFMDFVAEEYLQNVAQNASGRLLSLTDGRYFLRYEGGANGFVVGDNFNGGKTRGVYTLSGGETFLVSLSLALSLSAEICQRSLKPIEFFFLDEGFGTLDEKLVDTVMDSLERLKSENFSIGIISHVEELKHRIVKKLLVKKATEGHGSQLFAE